MARLYSFPKPKCKPNKIMQVIAVVLAIFSFYFIWGVQSATPFIDDSYMHPHIPTRTISKRSILAENLENKAKFWRHKAEVALDERLNHRINENIAKNVILFLGDGMSIPTLTATRVYLGGEEAELAFDKFPFTALSKTYCVDNQVADSACSSTAYLGGVKGNLGTIGVTGDVKRKDCQAMVNSKNHVQSIAHHFQKKGKRTGFVTTARVTHASPAGLYAHTADRDWEWDTKVIKSNNNPHICHDIAHQLVRDEPGKYLNVIMGGGRAAFYSANDTDAFNINGLRSDNRNLIKEWLEMKQNENAKFIWNRNQLLNVTNNDTDYLMGLFTPDHMSFNLDRNPENEPSLAEMTIKAIEILQKNNEGYFLFVEGARIDMAHHETMARRALNETVEFNNAIMAALNMTNNADTLIVVTADHAHTMSVSGYAERGNDILGIGGEGQDRLPYTTLNYANGPGYKYSEGVRRYDISKDDISQYDYKYPSITPLVAETHGGDDVAVFATGPWSHLFTGVMEENLIPYLMSYASCVGDSTKACDNRKEF